MWSRVGARGRETRHQSHRLDSEDTAPPPPPPPLLLLLLLPARQAPRRERRRTGSDTDGAAQGQDETVAFAPLAFGPR